MPKKVTAFVESPRETGDTFVQVCCAKKPGYYPWSSRPRDSDVLNIDTVLAHINMFKISDDIQLQFIMNINIRIVEGSTERTIFCRFLCRHINEMVAEGLVT